MNNNPKSYGWYAIILLTIGHFFSDFYANFLPALLPVIMANLGLSLTTSDLLVMIFSITSSVLQPICGYFIDKNGYTWLLLITLPVSALLMCLSGLAPTTFVLFTGIALAGLTTSLFHPISSSLVGKITTSQTQGMAMSVFIGGGNFGYALAPAIIIYLLVHYGTISLPWLIVPGFLLTIAYYVSGLHRINLATPRHAANANQAWYKSGSILKLNAVMALRSWPQVAVPTFLPVLLASQGHPPTLAGDMLTVFLVSGALGGFIGGYIGDRFGYKNSIVASLAFALLPMYIFLQSTNISSITWIALGLCGAALQSTVPSSIVWAQQIMPANAAMASGMMLGLTFGLGGVGTAITGAAADVFGLQPALLLALLPLAITLPLVYSIPNSQTSQVRSIQS